MNWQEFFGDHSGDLVALLALVALIYQIRSGNQQFKLLNKGYLDAKPRLDLGIDSLTNATRLNFGEAAVVPPELSVDALNPVIELENVGNLPLKYSVRKFAIWIGEELRSPPLTDLDLRWTPKTGQGGWLNLKPTQSHVEETSFA